MREKKASSRTVIIGCGALTDLILSLRPLPICVPFLPPCFFVLIHTLSWFFLFIYLAQFLWEQPARGALKSEGRRKQSQVCSRDMMGPEVGLRGEGQTLECVTKGWASLLMTPTGDTRCSVCKGFTHALPLCGINSSVWWSVHTRHTNFPRLWHEETQECTRADTDTATATYEHSPVSLVRTRTKASLKSPPLAPLQPPLPLLPSKFV